MAPQHVEDPAHTTGYEAQRLHTSDMEIGVTDAVQRHVKRNVVPPKPVSQRKLDFEHARPRWMREMAAETLGVFFYVYPGIASTASFFLNSTETAFGSIFQIGWAYAIGIAFAIITCASTSGGHFNPAITICFAIWQGYDRIPSLKSDRRLTGKLTDSLGRRFHIISLLRFLAPSLPVWFLSVNTIHKCLNWLLE